MLCGGTRPDILRPFRSKLSELAKVELDRKELVRKMIDAVKGHKSQNEKDERFDSEVERALLDVLLKREAASVTSLVELLKNAEQQKDLDETEVKRLLKSEVVNVSMTSDWCNKGLAAHLVVRCAGR